MALAAAVVIGGVDKVGVNKVGAVELDAATPILLQASRVVDLELSQ
jgi:hypothetical protein